MGATEDCAYGSVGLKIMAYASIDFDDTYVYDKLLMYMVTLDEHTECIEYVDTQGVSIDEFPEYDDFGSDICKLVEDWLSSWDNDTRLMGLAYLRYVQQYPKRSKYVDIAKVGKAAKSAVGFIERSFFAKAYTNVSITYYGKDDGIYDEDIPL